MIAVRYSAVRTQGFKDSVAEDPIAGGEHRVLDYRVQQYRTFKGLALAYMLNLNTVWIRAFVRRVQKAVNNGDLAAADELPELHASAAGLKVWSTLLVGDTMEDLRRSCGGQGFLRSSAMGDLVTEFGVAITAEGEQVILSMQVARFLVSQAKDVKAGKAVVGTMKYLEEPPFEGAVDLGAGKPELLVALFRDRARRFALDLEERMSGAMDGKGMSFDDALNLNHVAAYKACEVHTWYIMARNFQTAIEEFVTDPACKAAVSRLLELVLLQQVRENGVDWIDQLNSKQIAAALDRVNALLEEIRPDAVGLADALGHSDKGLGHSTLGRYDGNVYEAIYARAKLSPLNNREGGRMLGWEHFAKVLDLDFLREGMKTQRALEGQPSPIPTSFNPFANSSQAKSAKL